MFPNRLDLSSLTLVYRNKAQVAALLKKSDVGYT
jgi:hypothetical protein